MTYDKNKMTSYPNAPIGWMRDVIRGMSQVIASNSKDALLDALRAHLSQVTVPRAGLSAAGVSSDGGASPSTLRSKILMGLPLYGWRGQEPMTGAAPSGLFHFRPCARRGHVLIFLAFDAV